ncbi:MAG: hypothetical protein JEZ07_06810 [Phycisphaerae bacterium]|nr:hypothetical protein [Phycisphaerae bacterium]
MDQHIILGVHVTERLQQVAKVQQILTDFGCSIKTRLGLHEIEKGADSTNGLLILDMIDDTKKVDEFKATLSGIEGVEVQQMIFKHPQ